MPTHHEINRAAEELRSSTEKAFPKIPAYRWEHAKGSGDPFQKDAALGAKPGGSCLIVDME